MAKQQKKSTGKAKQLTVVRRKIKKASKQATNFRALLYGRPGATKTRTLATAPDVLLIDVNEKGWDSIRRDLDVDVYVVEYWEEINDVFWYLQSGDHPYKSFGLDSMTAMQNLCMKFVLGDEASRDASRDPDMPSRQVWGKVGELMKTQITNYRNLPMNGIFTARQRNRQIGEEEDSDEFIIAPNLSPAIADMMEGAVPIIGHLSQREVRVKKKGQKKRVTTVRRRLLVGPSERYITKERYGVFESYVDAPNLAEMIEACYGVEPEVEPLDEEE